MDITSRDIFSVSGIVSKRFQESRCSLLSKQHDVAMLTEETLGWISAIITQNTPVFSVLWDNTENK